MKTQHGFVIGPVMYGLFHCFAFLQGPGDFFHSLEEEEEDESASQVCGFIFLRVLLHKDFLFTCRVKVLHSQQI